MDVQIDVSEGAAGPHLRALIEHVTNRRPLNAALGKRGEVELREHFLERNQEPNKRGWPKQDFWNRIRKSTALSTVDASGATVTISDPAINQKVFGGDITPKEGKYLAIAAIAEAYGRSPRSFSNLEPVIRWRDGQRRAVALAERRASLLRSRKDGTGTEKKREEVGGKIFYWLVEKIRQKKDPRALPKPEIFERALFEEADIFVQDILR
ncbi:MAG TPA: hypothetical protein VNP98_17390 [Chthoniobacterales bacterium]|nr:hypothetical protein [Chthoniobacterales bacterium]